MKIGLEKWERSGEGLLNMWEAAQREVGMEAPDVDRDALQAAGSSLLLAVAREGSAALGFVLFALTPDLMRKGRKQAVQLCWYTRKGAGRLGLPVLLCALEECRRLRVNEVMLVAPMEGRGARRAPEAFQQLGAICRQRDYSLEMEL